MPRGGGPGAGDPFDPFDLDDVRMRVVMPVVTALVSPADLKRVEIGWVSLLPRGQISPVRGALAADPGDDDNLWVVVTAAGSKMECELWQRDQIAPYDTLGEAAFQFAIRLEEWVDGCIGWGEDHVAEYLIPARSSGGGSAATDGDRPGSGTRIP